MIFNFKIEKLVILLIPSFFRKARMVGWIRTLSAPISQLYYDFIQKRYLDIKKLGLNGQVCYLRKALNTGTAWLLQSHLSAFLQNSRADLTCALDNLFPVFVAFSITNRWSLSPRLNVAIMSILYLLLVVIWITAVFAAFSYFRDVIHNILLLFGIHYSFIFVKAV